ncbi:hypothetical protein TBR22_A07760 [Luteitalea sp. TBR-22]|nr:hypothetical protein TBR22_A07760 [Luteitalea sp. TBR-22]
MQASGPFSRRRRACPTLSEASLTVAPGDGYRLKGRAVCPTRPLSTNGAVGDPPYRYFLNR